MLTTRRLGAIAVAGVFVAAAAFAMLFTRPGPESYDAKIMLQVTHSLLAHGNFRVLHDEFGFNTPYASYGIGMSFAFALPYEVARIVHGNPDNAAMTTNAYIFGLAAIAIAGLARRTGLSWGKALITTVLVGTGTMLLPYVPTGFSELGVAAGVALGLFAVAAARQRAPWAAVVGGVAGGGAALFRSDSLALVVPAIGLGVWLAGGRRWRTVVDFGLGILPFLLFLAWYNTFRFGSPFDMGYSKTEGFTYPFFLGLHGLLYSPGRGLIWYVPLVAVAVAGGKWAWQRDPVLTGAAAYLLFARVLFYASWSQWYGGVCWGPRFLVPGMPALAVGLVEVVRRFGTLRIPTRLAVGLVAALSIAVQIVGAVVGYEFSWNIVHSIAAAKGEPDAYLFAFRYFPIRDEAGWLFSHTAYYVGRALPPDRAPMLFAALIVLTLWGVGVALFGIRRLSHGLPVPAEAEGAPPEPEPVAETAGEPVPDSDLGPAGAARELVGAANAGG